MTLSHERAQDLLEGYALWSLDRPEHIAVARHLAECEVCRAAAGELEDIVAAIPESVGARAPSSGLRERVLSAARTGGAVPARGGFPRWLGAPWPLPIALLLIAIVSGGTAIGSRLELQRVAAERDRYLAIVSKVSEGGRWWYMAGVNTFAGSGGTLIDPKRDGAAFVLFHDLKPVPAGTRYTIWLIRPDASWVRAANFTPSGDELERIDVPFAVSEFVQCAVTIETRETGVPQGPLAMQSRVFGQ